MPATWPPPASSATGGATAPCLPVERIAFGYGSQFVGENLARGQQSVRRAPQPMDGIGRPPPEHHLPRLPTRRFRLRRGQLGRGVRRRRRLLDRAAFGVASTAARLLPLDGRSRVASRSPRRSPRLGRLPADPHDDRAGPDLRRWRRSSRRSCSTPKRPTTAKTAPYECGIVPEDEPAERFPVKFYLVAMAFIVLDVEIIFLYPFTTIFRELGGYGLDRDGRVPARPARAVRATSCRPARSTGVRCGRSPAACRHRCSAHGTPGRDGLTRADERPSATEEAA